MFFSRIRLKWVQSLLEKLRATISAQKQLKTVEQTVDQTQKVDQTQTVDEIQTVDETQTGLGILSVDSLSGPFMKLTPRAQGDKRSNGRKTEIKLSSYQGFNTKRI